MKALFGIHITTQTVLTFTGRVVPDRRSTVEPYRELSKKKKRITTVHNA